MNKFKIIIIILAETDTMYARGAHSLEDILPDGWTLRSGDGAEELTSGVATKGEQSPLLIRATQAVCLH